MVIANNIYKITSQMFFFFFYRAQNVYKALKYTEVLEAPIEMNGDCTITGLNYSHVT